VAAILILPETDAKRTKQRKKHDLDDYYDDDYSKDDYKDDYVDDEYYDDDYNDEYDDDYQDDYQTKRDTRNRKKPGYKSRQNFRRYGRMGDYDSDYGSNDYDANYNQDYSYDDYVVDPANYNARMKRVYARNTQTYRGMMGGKAAPMKRQKPIKKFVPVIVSKKEKKKTKVITTQSGFYIPDGTQMFGKFTDLHSCQKACSIMPECFAGDFNPWTKKCYNHGNRTACSSMKSHAQITHFKKVFCSVVDSPRGLVTLGTMMFKGMKLHGVKDLQTCVKKCVNMGNGIAAKNSADSVRLTPQLCFGVDYDFATHECHAHIRSDADFLNLCTDVDTIVTPALLYPNPSSVNILICLLAKMT